MITHSSKLKAQSYNSKVTSFELQVKVLTFDFYVLSLQAGGLFNV